MHVIVLFISTNVYFDVLCWFCCATSVHFVLYWLGLLWKCIVDPIEVIFSYVTVTTYGILKDDILNMDETPCFFDMSGGQTFTIRGCKDVLQKTSGYDKLR